MASMTSIIHTPLNSVFVYILLSGPRPYSTQTKFNVVINT